MVSTTYYDPTFGVRQIGGRTDTAGTAVDDMPFEQDALINAILTEGYLTSDAFVVAADSPASMDVIVGSGTAKADIYVVATDETGRHPYLVRLDDVSDTITVDASDASNPRIDEIWLVVRDSALSGDAGTLNLPRLAYRKGDAAASPTAPGADSAWAASVKLATITVGAGVTSITSGNIADNRATTNLTSTLVDAVFASASLADLGTANGSDLDDLGTFMSNVEVDASTEVGGPVALTTSAAAVASVNLSIPAGWNTWRCEAYATFGHGQDGAGGSPIMNARVRIDGTDQQLLIFTNGDSIRPGAVGGRRAGMTTTGTRTVQLRAHASATGETPELTDIYLYARAVRTS